MVISMMSYIIPYLRLIVPSFSTHCNWVGNKQGGWNAKCGSLRIVRRALRGAFCWGAIILVVSHARCVFLTDRYKVEHKVPYLGNA